MMPVHFYHTGLDQKYYFPVHLSDIQDLLFKLVIILNCYLKFSFRYLL